MNEQAIIPANEVSFKDFLFKNKRNRTILILAGVAVVVQFAIFKYLYPYASFIHGDSFAYLKSAYLNSDINYYMIGYSKFLRIFGTFTSSDTALVFFQYLFIQFSALIFLFTVFYFYKPNKGIQNTVLAFIVFNPLFLHLANIISSDCFFASLSLLWFTILIRIIHNPSPKLLVLHALILFIAFTVRYNALIYPLISIVAFCLAKLPPYKKTVGISAGFIVCFLFILFTGNKYKTLTGTWQYSPFSGWQLANNAMYSYRYVPPSQRQPVPKRFKQLDNAICIYFDSTRDLNKYPYEALQAGTLYMWSKGLPLEKYMNYKFKKDSLATEFNKWASMGPFYSDYGIYIIKQYPYYFIRFFLWPNFNKYFAPPVEYLGIYNTGQISVMPIAQSWFEYSGLNLRTRTKNFNVTILNFLPIFSGIINIGMVCSLTFYLMLKGWNYYPTFKRGLFLSCTNWILNFCFTIFASSVALRFQIFPLIVTTIFVALSIDWIIKLMAIKEKEILIKPKTLIEKMV